MNLASLIFALFWKNRTTWMFLAIAIVLCVIPKNQNPNQEIQSDGNDEDYNPINLSACISTDNETICGKTLKILPEPSSNKVFTSQQCLKLCEIKT